MPNTRFMGMRAFMLVWAGQFVSLLGTAMTQFALAIWAWELTGQATALALVAFFNFAPAVILSPLAGALVDRWNRKLVMMLSDLGAGVATIAVFLLYISGNLQIWHLYIAGAFTGVFQSFQFPAYSAAISMMIPKEQYARADALLGLAQSFSTIFAPILAGILLTVVGIGGIMLNDIVTFLVALATLLVVHIPQPPLTEAGKAAKSSLLRESLYGFKYIFERPSLLGLQLIFFFGNFLMTMALVLITPLVLSRVEEAQNALLSQNWLAMMTQHDIKTISLGVVHSTFGIGGVVGGLALAVWGGPKRRVTSLLGGWLLSNVGIVIMGMGTTLPVWIMGGFAVAFFIPFIDGSNQAIWQAKVAPDVQGRVFAVRRVIAQITAPVSMVIAGPLVDHLLEPAMMPGGSLVPLFGGVVGTGRGAGMGLLFVITGLLTILVTVGAYLTPVIWNAESILPDHDSVVIPAASD